MAFQVILTVAADRSLRSLSKHVQKRIQRWIDLLAQEPLRTGTRQLVGHPGIRRVHASKDHVILYSIDHGKINILILRIENRRDVYRNI